jgi:hypothetical protein
MAAGLSLALVISATVAAPADATGAHRPPHITYVTGNTLSTFDGTDWTDPAQTLRRGPIGTNFIRSSSCALPTYCVSVGAHVAVVSRGG